MSRYILILCRRRRVRRRRRRRRVRRRRARRRRARRRPGKETNPPLKFSTRKKSSQIESLILESRFLIRRARIQSRVSRAKMILNRIRKKVSDAMFECKPKNKPRVQNTANTYRACNGTAFTIQRKLLKPERLCASRRKTVKSSLAISKFGIGAIF